MNRALGFLVGGCIVVVCVLAVLLNPGLGVLVGLLFVLASIYALRALAANTARARRKRKANKKS